MKDHSHTQALQADRLVFLGLLLFLIGLAVGLVVHSMTNPRMALAAHLEGVMNGMFLMVLGLLWKRLVLSPRWLSITFWLSTYGTFANLLAVLIAAATGFGKMMPIAGGQEGTPLLEGIISFLLISLALCMLLVVVMVIIGFRRQMTKGPDHVTG
jgi:hydroxylaminobenzene mutase